MKVSFERVRHTNNEIGKCNFDSS